MKQFLRSLLFLLSTTRAFAQVDCGNIGFEQGSPSGWALSYGTVTDQNQQTVFQTEMTGTLANMHYVTGIADGNDRRVPAIPMVAPGSTHSIRIGNVDEGSYYARIKTNYTVTSDNTLFQYKFAVVLQNTTGTDNRANHEPYQKPGFNILIYDGNGQELSCSSYNIQLQGNNTVDGFQTSGDIQYRNWTTGAIDLRDFVGKSLTIVVTAHGCTRQRHFGYAYFDAECLKSEITQLSACADENGLIDLAAPGGFAAYQWNNGMATQRVKVPAQPGDRFQVRMVPIGSLDQSCALTLDYEVPFRKMAATVDSTICEGNVVAMGDTVYRTAGTFIRNVSKSNVCDSIVTLNLKVNPVASISRHRVICEGDSLAVADTTYRTAGTYVRNIPQATGCDSIVTTFLEVVRLDVSVQPVYSITEGDSVQVHPLVEPAGNYIYHWDQPGLSCSDCPDPYAHPASSTLFQLQVTDADQVCRKLARVQVYVKPCGVAAPQAFSPNQDQVNEVFHLYGNACVRLIRDMRVYNRWGEVVFQKSNFAASDPSAGWDGNYHGLQSPAGAYPYKVRAELQSGAIVDYAGTVTLLR